MALVIVAALPTGAFARSGDTTADRVLGQPDLFHNAPNTVDGNVFNQPNQLALDKSVTPYRLYVADWQNNRVLGFHSVAALTTGGYADLVVGQADFYSAGCPFPGTQSSLCTPAGIAVDSAGNLFVADQNSNRVVKFSNPFAIMRATGRKAGFQASLVLGQPDFSANLCNRSAAVNAATLCAPVAVALDSHNNLFVADANNQRVLEYNAGFITAANASKVFGQLGSFTSNSPNKGGLTGRSLDLSPQAHSALAVDANNTLYVADFNNNRVLRFNTPLTSDTANAVFGQLGKFTQNICDINSGPNANSLCGPFGVTVDKAGDVFIADSDANRVLEYKPPIALNPTANVVFGGFCSPLSSGAMCTPAGVGVDSSGNLYVNDLGNNRLLEFFPPFPPFPFAGQILGQPDSIHNAPNSVDVEGMDNPTGVALDLNVTPNHLYVAEQTKHRILGYRNAASFVNNQPADIVIGQPDFYSSICNQAGGPNQRNLCGPNGIAVDKSGNLFVADFSNSRVLEFSSPFNSGYTTNQPAFAVFGQGGRFTTGGCNSQNAGHTPLGTSLCNPAGVAISAASAGSGDTTADRVFGQGDNFASSLCNLGGTAPSGNTLCYPWNVAFDSASNLYITDFFNNRVTEYDLPVPTPTPTPKPTTHAGTCSQDTDPHADAYAAQNSNPDTHSHGNPDSHAQGNAVRHRASRCAGARSGR
ncbi:MAG TPA: NHL repeat-containing protein [Candidatus Binataceae bacterium]|jgi:sugar lactone lactonase YvrE|nr:NHL repeat-containing protein [Candidatus Binataceae bacterium]